MLHAFRVNEAPGDVARWIDACGEGELARTCASVRGVERGQSAIRSPREAVLHAIRVNVVSRNRSCRIDAFSKRAYGAGGLERCDGATGIAQEGLTLTRAVAVASRNRTRRVDGRRLRASDADIERREGAVGEAQEAVGHEPRVKVESSDDVLRVDARDKGSGGTWDIKRCHSATPGP